MSTPTSKDTNPKAAFGDVKASIQCCPLGPLSQVGEVMRGGALKYGKMNWRETGVRASTYVDAIWRHYSAWVEGETYDPESGHHHLAHVAACCVVVLDAQAGNGLHDDRVKGPAAEVMRMLQRVREAKTDTVAG